MILRTKLRRCVRRAFRYGNHTGKSPADMTVSAGQKIIYSYAMLFTAFARRDTFLDALFL